MQRIKENGGLEEQNLDLNPRVGTEAFIRIVK